MKIEQADYKSFPPQFPQTGIFKTIFFSTIVLFLGHKNTHIFVIRKGAMTSFFKNIARNRKSAAEDVKSSVKFQKKSAACGRARKDFRNAF